MTRWLERDRVRFAYEVRGRGPWLLALHGLGGDRAQAQQLVAHADWGLISIDLRGHGETGPVGRVDAYSFGTFADDVVALLDRLRVDRVVVVGVSMGAGVAVRLALDNPGRAQGIVCVRPAWTDERLPPNLAVFGQIAELLRREGAEAGLARFKESAAYRRIFAVSEAAAASLCAQFTQARAVERVVRLERMPASVPFDDFGSLRDVRLPSLVLGCDRDPIHPVAVAREWARTLRTRLVMVTSKADDPAAYLRDVQAAVSAILRTSFAPPSRSVSATPE